MRDSIVDSVREDLLKRSQRGIEKYQTTLDRIDLELVDWLQHAYEETLDKALYLKKAMDELRGKKFCKCPINENQSSQ